MANKKKNETGQMIILALVLSSALLILITGLVAYWMTQIKHHKQAIGRTQALSIAEGGLELAIWKLNNQPGYSGETNTVYGNGTYNVTITNLGSTVKQIRADAFVPNAANPVAKRSVQVTATIGTVNVGFNYGVQVGNGGLELTNSATIVGNVYANGNIRGTNSARIQGTAIAAGPSGIIEGMDIDNNSWSHTIRGGSNVLGNATHSVIQNTNVTGNVVADSISNCSIGGSATYDTRSSCTVSGAVTTPNPNTFTAPAVLPLPIDETQIDAWEAEASAGGTIGTQSFNSGTRTLGPVKINGDLILTNDAQVIITGTIWVTGNITLSQTSIIRLSSGYGGLSGVIIAGVDESPTTGTITIGQSTQALGSGTAGSYLMLLSQKEGVATIAISTSQSSGSAILYAGEGMIEVSQSGSLKEITAEKLRITNSATVTYETGLANTNFTSGPGGGWEIQDQTWQLLQ